MYLNGNNLTVMHDNGGDSNLYTYNHEQIVSRTNIPRLNNSSVGNWTGIVSYTIDLDDFPSNTAPIVSNANSKSAFTAVPANIQLEVNDQDGDALTYTIIDAPTNGHVVTEGCQV